MAQLTNIEKNSGQLTNIEKNSGPVFFVSITGDFYLVGEDEDLFLLAQDWGSLVNIPKN